MYTAGPIAVNVPAVIKGNPRCWPRWYRSTEISTKMRGQTRNIVNRWPNYVKSHSCSNSEYYGCSSRKKSHNQRISSYEYIHARNFSPESDNGLWIKRIMYTCIGHRVWFHKLLVNAGHCPKTLMTIAPQKYIYSRTMRKALHYFFCGALVLKYLNLVHHSQTADVSHCIGINIVPVFRVFSDQIDVWFPQGEDAITHPSLRECGTPHRKVLTDLWYC